MEENKEVKIAIIIGIIMITICIVMFITVKSKNKVNNIDVKVYKLYENTNDEGKTEYQYRPCTINNTDTTIDIYRETAKALKLTEDSLIVGKQIKGEYKVEYNGKMIALDINDDQLVYLNDTQKLYKFNSDIYEKVKNVCQ